MEVEAENFLHKTTSTDLNEELPDDVEYFPSPNNEISSKSTFGARNIFLFSNYLSLSQSNCEKNGSHACFADNSGCFTTQQKCDGNFDCGDKSDEKGCLDHALLQLDHIKKYRLSRKEMILELFDRSQCCPETLWSPYQTQLVVEIYYGLVQVIIHEGYSSQGSTVRSLYVDCSMKVKLQSSKVLKEAMLLLFA